MVACETDSVPHVYNGTETEYSIYLRDEMGAITGWRRLETFGRLYQLCRPEDLMAIGVGTNLFLENGGRLYIDGSLPEYATPECDSVRGAYVAGEAGDHIMSVMLQNGVDEGIITGYALHKRVLNQRDPHVSVLNELADQMGYSATGPHNSIGIRMRENGVKISRHNLELWGLYAAVRSVLTGAGGVLPRWPEEDGRGVGSRYIIHQKAPFICKDYSNETTFSRGVVNLRKESLVGVDVNWARVHDASGDANILPYAQLMNIGMARIVVKLIDAGYKPPFEPGPDGLAGLAWHTANDLTCQKAAVLGHKKRVRPVEILEDIVLQMQDYGQKYGLSPQEQWVTEEAETSICALKEQRWKALVGRLDWVSKKFLLDRYKENNGIAAENWAEDELVRQDQRYDLRSCSDGSRSSVAALDRLPVVRQYRATETEIATAMYNAPTGGRAPLRGAFAQKYGFPPGVDDARQRAEDQVLTMGWEGALLEDGNERRSIQWPLFDGTSSYSAAPIDMLYNGDNAQK